MERLACLLILCTTSWATPHGTDIIFWYYRRFTLTLEKISILIWHLTNCYSRFLLLSMLPVCLLKTDLSGKMFMFLEESNSSYVQLTPTGENFTAVSVCLRSVLSSQCTCVNTWTCLSGMVMLISPVHALSNHNGHQWLAVWLRKLPIDEFQSRLN